MIKGFILTLLTFTLLIGAFYPAYSGTDSIAVSGSVVSANITFEGVTAPNDLVSFTQDHLLLGITSSDASGSFQVNYSVGVPGLHTYTITSQDSQARSSGTITTSVDTPSNVQSVVNNIVLSPTISANVTPTGKVVIYGLAVPLSTVTIYLDRKNIEDVTADATGDWNSIVDTTSLAIPGSYTANATDVYQNFPESLFSPTVTFSLNPILVIPSPSVVVTPTVIPSPVIQPVPQPSQTVFVQATPTHSDYTITLNQPKVTTPTPPLPSSIPTSTQIQLPSTITPTPRVSPREKVIQQTLNDQNSTLIFGFTAVGSIPIAFLFIEFFRIKKAKEANLKPRRL